MWSGPRNISTTMMRSFGARADTAAIDEPFYACYLKRSGALHPYRDETLRQYPSEFADVVRWVAAPRRAAIVFMKHIAYHLADEDDLSFSDAHRNFLLIRDPRAMVASYKDRFDDLAPIARSYQVAQRIRDRSLANGAACPIVDAADILAAPEQTLRLLCSALGVPFDPAMLNWEAGSRLWDGPWAPHWYAAVRSSSGFRESVEKPIELTVDLEAAAAQSMPHYSVLRSQSLRPDPIKTTP